MKTSTEIGSAARLLGFFIVVAISPNPSTFAGAKIEKKMQNAKCKIQN